MWECDVCKNKAPDEFIGSLCLDCKRQYIGQEAEDYKPDRFEQREEEKIQYPTLEKLRKVEGKSHLCGEFLDFIRSKYVLFDPAIPREQFGYVGSGDYINSEKLLAEFFGIDLEQAEEERQQILKSLHSQN